MSSEHTRNSKNCLPLRNNKVILDFCGVFKMKNV